MITKNQTPYEFLVRWSNGEVSGAHIRFLETVREDGALLAQKEGDAKPVSMAGEAGFPIADVLTVIQVNALADLAAAQAQVVALQAQIAAYTPPLAVDVQSVTMRQARLALLGAGLLDAVNAGMAAMPQDVQIEWQFASTVDRSSPQVAALAALLGLDDAAVDALFATARTL